MAQDQVTSLVMSGVFETVPQLQIVMVECGIAWVAPLMWRLDRAWEMLGAEVPELRQPPSRYIQKQFSFTTQPMEEPPDPRHFVRQLEYAGIEDRLMFSSDYPHWDFDAPDRALPRVLPDTVRTGIMAGHARALYGFPEPAGEGSQ
jgi:predicted TIM-barrel fold metal-dependent hydrolase